MEKYERVKKIGEGSFGKALLVRRKHDGRHCVVKEVAIGKMSPKEREESKKEVKVLSQLKHPNIVMYQESFEGLGNLYIVMDYCEGGDLYQKITSQRGINFSEGQIIDYFVQICLALKHIHDRKILHRDLKSQNIFLTRHGIIKLGDFGIARVLKSTVELARTCIGTPYYLSPEICENRPYNNKSDIWSLGCVLYELCTLKHAFEAGNMKNLVLKIIRGNYPPIPNRYTPALRSLVSQCFKRSPIERPSVNKILKYPIIQERIKKFLSPEVIEDEFSHTVLHKEKFNAPKQPMARPISAVSDARKQNPVAQVYGVSVAKRPVPGAKKPVVAGAAQQKRPSSAAARRPGGSSESRLVEERRKEMEARERRRQNMIEKQEQEYQEYLKNIHKKRYEKQQAERMNRAREAGWKNLLQNGEDKNKKPSIAMAKQNDPMAKYLPNERPKVKPEDKRENLIGNDVPVQRPISARERPFEAYVAAKEARENRVMGAEAAERARLVEEFKQRKREAAENRARGINDFKPPAVQQPKVAGFGANRGVQLDRGGGNPPRAQVVAAPSIQARNKEEQAYLQQLENIRRQNYIERKALQNRNKPPLPVNKLQEERPSVPVALDPRFDPEARRQKIAALKAQADQRAMALKDELNRRRRDLQERLENDRQSRELQRAEQQKKLSRNDERPLPAQQNKGKEIKPKIAEAAIGLETAMNQVAAARLFRSCSEGDLQKIIKKGEELIHDRKHWGQPSEDIGLSALPLEATASAMEATSFNDVISKPSNEISRPNSAHHRRNWQAVGKTQLLSALENKTLAPSTILPAEKISTSPNKGATVVLPKSSDKPKAIGETIILPKKQPSIAEKDAFKRGLGRIGETITLSSPKKEAVDEKEKVALTTETKDEAAGKSSEEGLSGESKVENEKESINMQEKKDTMNDNDEDDSDIEELTAVSVEAAGGKEKPKARAAWGANKQSPLKLKDEVEDTGANKGRDGEQLDQRKSEDEKLESEKDEELFKRTDNKEKTGNSDDISLQDVSAEDESFHTPNASLMETRSKALKTGLYDSPAKILRTVSMPEIARDPPTTSQSRNKKENELEDDGDDVIKGKEEEHRNKKDMDEIREDDDDDETENADDIVEDDNGDNDVDDEEYRSDEEIEDFEQMLDSMRGVLSSTDASPPTSSKIKIKKDAELKAEDGDTDEEDDTRCSSSASKKSNEEWESDDDDDDDDDDDENASDFAAATVKSAVKEATRTAKRTKARETLFQRIEESRKSLEDELGTDKFLKVYRYIQAMQENEDDDMNIDPSKDVELADMLEGKNEHLYQRILYLVLADAAYFEDNE